MTRNMSGKALMRRKIYAYDFAILEFGMYLDTHPCDRTANEMFRKYTDEAKMLRREYESKYGPLTISASNEADWLNDPWPWERGGAV